MNTTEAKVPNKEGNWQSIEIFLFSNGQQYSPPRKYHLRAEELNWWDATLNQLARSHYGIQHPLIYLYTTDGRLVEGPLELKDGMAYVAVEPPERFIDAGYEKYLIRATRSWEKRQARKKTPACELEQPCCICPVKEACKLYASCCICPEKDGAAIAECEEYQPPDGHIVSSVLAKSGAAETLTGENEPRAAEYEPRPAEYGPRLNENGTKSSEQGTKFIERGAKRAAHEAYSDESDVDIGESTAQADEQRTTHGEYLVRPIKSGPRSHENQAIPMAYGVGLVRQETEPGRNDPWTSVAERRTDDMQRELENDIEEAGADGSANNFSESIAREDELAQRKNRYKLAESQNKADESKPGVDEYEHSVGEQEPNSSKHESRLGDAGKVIHEPRSEERRDGPGKSGARKSGNGTRLEENKSNTNNHGVRPRSSETKVDEHIANSGKYENKPRDQSDRFNERRPGDYGRGSVKKSKEHLASPDDQIFDDHEARGVGAHRVSGGEHRSRRSEPQNVEDNHSDEYRNELGNQNDHRARSGDIGRKSGDHERTTAEQRSRETNHRAANVGERGVGAAEQTGRETDSRNLSERAGDQIGNGGQRGIRATEQGGRETDNGARTRDLGGGVGGNGGQHGIRAAEQRDRADDLGGRAGDLDRNRAERGVRAIEQRNRATELTMGDHGPTRTGDQRRRVGNHGSRLSDREGRISELGDREGDLGERAGDHAARVSEHRARGGEHLGRAGDINGRVGDNIGRASDRVTRVNGSRSRPAETGARVSIGSRGGEPQARASPGGRVGEHRDRANSGGRSVEPEAGPGSRGAEARARLSCRGRSGEPGPKLSSGGRSGEPRARLSSGGRGGEPRVRVSSGGKPGVPDASIGGPIYSVGEPRPRTAEPIAGIGDPGVRRESSVVNGESGFPYISETQQHVRMSNLSTGKASTEKKRWSAGQASLARRQTPHPPLCVPPKKLEDKKPIKSNRESPATNLAGKAPARLPNGSAPSNEVETPKVVPKYPHKRFAPTTVPPPTGNFNQIVIKRKSNSLTKITSNYKSLATESAHIENVIGDKEIIVVSTNLYRNPESEITSLRLDSGRRHTMDGNRDSSDETQLELSVQQSIAAIPINEEVQTCFEHEFTEVVDKHGVAITTNSKIELTRTESGLRDNMVATDHPEENYISIINKGDVVNLKLNIEVRNGDRSGNSCQKNGRRSRSLTNVTRTEKESQISFDDDMYVQSKSLQSLLNNECFRGCGFEGCPKVVVVQCSCCAHGLKNPPRCDPTSCNDSKKYVVLVPNSQQEDSDDKCCCEPVCHSGQRIHPQSKKHSICLPVKKTVSNMSLETIRVRELDGCERHDIHVATTNSTVQTEDQKSEISTTKRKVSITEDSTIKCDYKTSLSQMSVSQTQLIVTKNSNCLQACQEMCSQAASQAGTLAGPQACSQTCPPIQLQECSCACRQVQSQGCSQGCLQMQSHGYSQISPRQTQEDLLVCPQTCPHAQSQGCPQTCPHAQSQGCPQTCPQAQSQHCPHSCPQSQSQGCPEACPQSQSQVCAQTFPQARSQASPQSCPQTQSQICPQSCPQVCPNICPQTYPQVQSQAQSLVGLQLSAQACLPQTLQVQSQIRLQVLPTLQVQSQAFQVQSQACSTTCPQICPQVRSQGCTQIRAQVCESYTQTDWCNVLLEVRRHENGRYSFHLPPLHVLRYYTF